MKFKEIKIGLKEGMGIISKGGSYKIPIKSSEGSHLKVAKELIDKIERKLGYSVVLTGGGICKGFILPFFSWEQVG